MYRNLWKGLFLNNTQMCILDVAKPCPAVNSGAWCIFYLEQAPTVEVSWAGRKMLKEMEDTKVRYGGAQCGEGYTQKCVSHQKP